MRQPVIRRPHLFEEEIQALVQDSETKSVDLAMRQHLENCDSCLLRLADLCSQTAPSTDTSMSLRAVNVAAARWREEFHPPGGAGTAEGKSANRAWQEAALLGKSGLGESGQQASAEAVAQDLLNLFLGKGKTKP